MSGAPGWVRSDLYDIDAKMDKLTAEELNKLDKTEKRHERNKMLQGLLVERFNLQSHWETRDQTIYALVIANKGPKMNQPKTDKPTRLAMGTGEFIGDSVTMGGLANALAEEVQRTV